MTGKIVAGVVLVSSAWLCACGESKSLDIGDVGVLGASLSDYAGRWEGYAEAYEFVDGSDAVRVLLDAQGVGVIEVGDSHLPDPEADAGYPPRGLFPGASNDGRFAEYNEKLAPGFSYPIEAAIIEENRIRFQTPSNEVYREWCGLMTPVHDDVNSGVNGNGEAYSCLPNAATGMMFDGTQETCSLGDESIDCGLLACIEACHCDAEGCQAHDQEPNVRFDGALQDQGEALEGTLVMGDRITLRLTRQ